MTDEPKRPSVTHHATTTTLPTSQPESQPDKQSNIGSGIDHGHEKAAPRPSLSSRPSNLDILLLFCIFVLLVWPWIFFGTVWAKKGIQMNNRTAQLVRNDPQSTTYFITLICYIISAIVTSCFSRAITIFSQELVTHYRPARPFHLTVLLALRHQNWPWGMSWKDVRYLMTKNRWWPTVLVIICALTFPQLLSNTTSLLTPIPFKRTSSLRGAELDFSSTDPVCLDWFKAYPLPNNCDWIAFQGQLYNTCFGSNQMLDVLEAGRGNIFETRSPNLTFSQLGGRDGLRFLGPIRGVLPLSPNGDSASIMLDPSALSDPETVAGMRSYNYTLNHQGLASKVSCTYQPTSPIVFALQNTTVAVNNVPSCRAIGESAILTGVTFFRSVNGANTLMYWACQSQSNNTQAPSYSIYLRGYQGGYEQTFGNITCTVSSKPAIFPVTYQSSRGSFSAGAVLSANEPAPVSPSAYSVLVNYTFIGLGQVISLAQNFDTNLVAESIINFGVKSFGLKPYAKDSGHLQLLEQMIQGILEYQTTYLRLLYSTIPDPPPSCVRPIPGFVTYEVLGWFVTRANIGFLIALTLINVAALVALLLALISAKADGYYPHLHPREVIYDPNFDEEVPDEWRRRVVFQPSILLQGDAY